MAELYKPLYSSNIETPASDMVRQVNFRAQISHEYQDPEVEGLSDPVLSEYPI